MRKINTLIKLLKKDRAQVKVAIFNNLIHIGLFNFLDDTTFLKLSYWVRFGKKLDLDNPISFNEKIQWLKLYDRNKDYVDMVDKIKVKEYVSKKISNDIIVPTIGTYDSFEEINFNNLPQQFVIKCNHDSGSIAICNNIEQFDIKKAKKIIKRGLKTNSFYWGREWPYKNVAPRIIIEKYLGNNISDYKVHCFNGEAKFILVCTDRSNNLKETFYDTKWNKMPFKRPNHDIDNEIEKPKNLESMIKYAEILSKNIPFLRVDFYEIDGNIFFGELTFYPASGWEKFSPDSWDNEIGSYLKLPQK